MMTCALVTLQFMVGVLIAL